MKRTVLCFILILTLIVIGCSSSTSNNSIKISPSKLFQGDAERLAPHFDMIPGCVKVNYKGNKKSIRLMYEIWKNGELQESQNAASRYLEDGKFNGEVSISITRDDENEENPNNFRIKTYISDPSGLGGVTQHVEGFEPSMAYGAVELQESITIKDDEEGVIWGVKAYEGAYNTNTNDDIEKSIKEADWGLILKLSFGTGSEDEVVKD